jgi:hypothetical protein
MMVKRMNIYKRNLHSIWKTFPNWGTPTTETSDTIKMNLRETGCEGVDWFHLAQGRDQVAGPCEHGDKTSGYIKGGESCDQLHDY